MKLLLSFLILAETLAEGWAYTQCRYSYYDSFRHKTIITYYRCSSREYCCGSHSCCTPVYSRWYLWFVISSFFFIVFVIWWYYRYRYRPRHAIIATAAPVVPAATYPSTGPITMINPNAGVVHYTTYPAYPGPWTTANPYPMQAPPPYSVVVPNR